MSLESKNNNSEETQNNPFSSFKKGFMLQLADILKWIGRISVVAIPVSILWFSGTGVNECVIGSNMPIIGGAITSVGLALLLGNPLIGILAGVVVGLILNIPFIQHLLCM
jgi:hypothetical protein